MFQAEMYRQGDVLLERIAEFALPSDAVLIPHLIVARGEATGHAHQIRDLTAAQQLLIAGFRYLRVVRPTALEHEEHARVPLEPGLYRVRLQREYTPRRTFNVLD
jgi:hypothetical protein